MLPENLVSADAFLKQVMTKSNGRSGDKDAELHEPSEAQAQSWLLLLLLPRLELNLGLLGALAQLLDGGLHSGHSERCERQAGNSAGEMRKHTRQTYSKCLRIDSPLNQGGTY